MRFELLDQRNRYVCEMDLNEARLELIYGLPAGYCLQNASFDLAEPIRTTEDLERVLH